MNNGYWFKIFLGLWIILFDIRAGKQSSGKGCKAISQQGSGFHLLWGSSNLFMNESNDRKLVYHPSNSEVNWFGMIVNLII